MRLALTDRSDALLHRTSPEARFAAMAQLRQNQPIARVLGPEGPFYLASRSAVAHALPQIEHFAGAVGAADVLEEEQAFNGLLEPKHGKIRRIVNGLIAPHKARKARPFLTDLCDRLLADVARRAAEGEVDVMRRYVDHVPASVIAWLLGWPVEDALQLYQWTVEICDRAMEMRPGSGKTSKEIHPVFAAYIEEKIEARLAEPESSWPDDGLGRLLTSEVDGQRLTPTFVRTQLQFLLGAGAETTRDAVGGLIYSLVADPELYQRVRADRGLIPNAIEEALRIYSPTQFMVRQCIKPIEIDGQPVARGESVFIGLASANRDESVFARSAEFDVERANASEHLAFGAGPHVCPGASLARMEVSVTVNRFLDRFADASLANGPGFEPLATPMFYGPKSLPLKLREAG